MGKRRVLSHRQKAQRRKVKMRERRARKEKDLQQDKYKDVKYLGPRRRQHFKQDQEEEFPINIDEAYIDTVLESEKPTITSECPIANVYSTLFEDREIRTEKPDTVDNQQHVMTECSIAHVYSTLSEDPEIKTGKPDIADNHHHVTSESDFVVETESSEHLVSEDKLITEEQPDPSLDNLEFYLEWGSLDADQSFIAVTEHVYNNLPEEIFQGHPS